MVGAITEVWSSILTWITTSMSSVQDMFYVDGALTFIGVLSVIGVAVGVCLLIFNVIRDFLHLR